VAGGRIHINALASKYHLVQIFFWHSRQWVQTEAVQVTKAICVHGTVSSGALANHSDHIDIRNWSRAGWPGTTEWLRPEHFYASTNVVRPDSVHSDFGAL